jgi:hypothetical protein
MLCGKESVMSASSNVVTSFCFIFIHRTVLHFTSHKVNREQKGDEREVKEKN